LVSKPRVRRAALVNVYPVRPDAPPEAWEISGLATLGRSRCAEIRLQDKHISRAHADFEARHDGLLVRDQASRHGTFVDGQPVSREGTLAPVGSVVRVGNALLLVVSDPEPMRSRPRRRPGGELGLPEPAIAGPALAAVWDEADRAGRLEDPVLILGETGTGKECVARMVHAARAEPGPFVGINVAAIPDGLFEAELFGYERGAFTGAAVNRAGAFREAASGLLFLDEVADLKRDMQAKLLRALDHHRIRPLGASRDVALSMRVVSATSRDLTAHCEDGSFRADLYYRLSGVVIHIPPLRERREDILLLAHEVLRQRAPELVLSTEGAEQLLLARWEGNARQLRHVVSQAAQRALARGERTLEAKHLPQLTTASTTDNELSLARIEDALRRSGGVAAHAARALGVSRTTFYQALKRLNGPLEPNARSGAITPARAKGAHAS
jgi:two-component system response regulator GlrR